MTSAPKILVAEDAPDLLDAIVLLLVEEGYQVQTARHGVEATAMVPEFEPDLVILDMRMPIMSGADACAAIRATSDVPIIMYTSSNDSAEVKDAILKGATDFVLKSTGISELTERVKFHLAKPEHPPPDTAPREKTTRKPADEIHGNLGSANSAKPVGTLSLIIDPDKGSRDLVKAVLTRLDQDFIEVDTAGQAISAFEQHGPDILITEWSLPDMDAFNMLSMLTRGQTGKKSRRVRKLLMSARLSPEAHRKAQYIGITDFLDKPLDRAQVEQIVADCVRQILRKRKRKTSKAA